MHQVFTLSINSQLKNKSFVQTSAQESATLTINDLMLEILHRQASIGAQAYKGSYSPRGRSRHLLETPLSTLVRTLLRAVFSERGNLPLLPPYPLLWFWGCSSLLCFVLSCSWSTTSDEICPPFVCICMLCTDNASV